MNEVLEGISNRYSGDAYSFSMRKNADCFSLVGKGCIYMGCREVLVGRVGRYRCDHSAGRLAKQNTY